MKHVIAIAIIGLMIFSACDSEIKETSAKTVSNESENKVVVTTTNDEALITLPSENGFPDSTFSAQREDNTSPEEKAKNLIMRKARTAFNKGLENYQAGEYTDAIKSFQSVLEYDPENAKAYYNLGKIYAMQGQHDLAISYYQDAVDHNPADSASLLGIGMIYFNKGNMNQSVEYYNRALEVAPNYALAYYNRGTVTGQLKNYTAALSDLTRSIELSPDDHQSYMNRGLVYYYTNQLEDACKDWRKAAALGNPEAEKAVRIYCTPKEK